MDYNFNHNHHPEKIGNKWIVPGIMLLIPGLRVVGAIWLFVLWRKSAGTNGKFGFWAFMAVMVLAGSAGDILGAAAKLFAPLAIIAAVLLGVMLFNKKSEDREVDYVSYIGDSPAVSIQELSKTLGIPAKLIEFDFRRMRKKGILPSTAYIDKARGVIVLTADGKVKEEMRQEFKKAAEFKQEKDFNESSYSKILRQIRALNDEIADPVVSEKIYHIESTTASIFKIVEQKPERVSEIQTFLEYYLPTTLKLLASYAQLERTIDTGENVRTSKASIENIMDKLVSGFDDQLDRLYKTEAIDITADVKTLEKMMKMEGLGSH